jgi:tRNA G18 (ribose-2'-O)-methylase SpoU
MENFNHDFNVSVVLRNTNAFNGKEMFYFSAAKKYDARGAVGQANYTNIQWLNSVDQLVALKEQYVLVGVDCVPGSVSMTGFEWPDNTLMVFGSEGVGLSKTVQSICSAIVHIDQFGSVPSLNAACASAIAMFDYTTKYNAARKL